MSFWRYFLVRLGWALLGLWLIATLVFLVFYVWADHPARQACGGAQASPACVALVTDQLDLDASVPEQYARFLWRLITDQSPGPAPFGAGEVGARLQAGELAREAVPATLSLVVPALLLAAGVGLLAGTALSRIRWRRIFDFPIYVAVGLSPVFLGLVLSIYPGYRWDLAPIAGYCDFFNPPPAVTPNESPCGGAVDWATHLVLPVITLSLYFAAVYTRVVRALSVQVRAETDPEKRARRRRRSKLLFVRSAGRDFGFAIGVGVLVEAAYSIPGLAGSTFRSAAAGSLVETQAYVLYATFLAIAVHFIVDVVVGALDPDLRWEKTVARRPKPA